MNNNIMLDLETLGLHPGSVIASIGAVRFHRGEIIGGFHVRIDVTDSISLGFESTQDTVDWWAKQSDEAQEELRGETPLRVALDAFSDWRLAGGPVDTVWGNGPVLDNGLLLEAYRRLGYERPWPHRADRCYRTVSAICPQIKRTQLGTFHKSVDDAESQARHLMRMIDI